MLPEEKSRVIIDRMFEEAGWRVVNRDDYSPNMTAVAIREGLMEGNKEADYLLFLNGKAIGVLEAKRIEVDINTSCVQEQAIGYTRSCPSWCQAWFPMMPLPLAYVSNGKELMFRDTRDKEATFAYRTVIHRPKEVVKLLGIQDDYAGLPTLSPRGLRACQFEAISNLETSFRTGERKALMVLATGAGKTYTACMAVYRLLSFTPMRRALFLVDRNNLGKQAESAFGTFRLTETGDTFTDIYTVNRLRSAQVPSESNVVISTIQRLFSLLKGEEIIDSDDDDDTTDIRIDLSGKLNLLPNFFDLIVIDECHRSIYGNWKKVLDYFTSAKMIGLTATPIPETVAFFNNNIIVNYSLGQSVVDNVNVDSRIYRIKTNATENGGAILEGEKVQEETLYTGNVQTISQQETRDYSKEELNRSIINPSQIKLILETYRDKVYTEMFTEPQREPNMDYLPKTLIFALNEAHATNIVQIAKEVFGRTDEKFVQKITYSASDSNELIRQFRNDKDFRIAVTCTLVATGTDIKPLEVVMFMRDVSSEPLYIQMKGRGVRSIDDEQLRNVTPNAHGKDCFFLVDAVGVTEHEMIISSPSDGPITKLISLKELLEKITHGNVPDDHLRSLAARLSRINKKSNDKQQEEFISKAGQSMDDMARQLYTTLEAGTLPPYSDVNEPNVERKALVRNLSNKPEARKYLLILNAGFITTLMPGEDELISAGFSKEEARITISAFEVFCKENKDEIEALRLIYNNEGTPLTYAMLKELEEQLQKANQKFSPTQLWNSYAILSPEMVKTMSTKEEKEALTNIIQLVRFVFCQITRLESLYPSAGQRFNLWLGQIQRTLTDDQARLMEQIVNYIASNGCCTVAEIKQYDKTQAAQFSIAFHSVEEANQTLASLAQFIIYRKTA